MKMNAVTPAPTSSVCCQSSVTPALTRLTEINDPKNSGHFEKTGVSATYAPSQPEIQQGRSLHAATVKSTTPLSPGTPAWARTAVRTLHRPGRPAERQAIRHNAETTAALATVSATVMPTTVMPLNRQPLLDNGIHSVPFSANTGRARGTVRGWMPLSKSGDDGGGGYEAVPPPLPSCQTSAAKLRADLVSIPFPRLPLPPQLVAPQRDGSRIKCGMTAEGDAKPCHIYLRVCLWHRTGWLPLSKCGDDCGGGYEAVPNPPPSCQTSAGTARDLVSIP